MEKSKTIKWIICRICLKDSAEKMLKIFPNESDTMIQENLVDQIQELGGITLYDSANLPDSICSKCLILLKVANKFRSLCQKSHHHLIEILQLNNPQLEMSNVAETYDLATQQSNVISNIAFKQEVESIHEEENSNGIQFIMEMVDNDEHIEPDIDVEEALEEVATEYVEFQNLSQNDDIEYLQDGIHELVTDGDSNTLSETANEKANENEISIQPTEEFIILTEEETKEKFLTQKGRNKNQKNSKIDDSDFKIVQKFTRKRKTKAISTTTKVRCKAVDDENNSFICFQCGNIYAERSKLTLHLKVHNKEKPHECEICHKKFAQTPQLSRHMNSHTGSRPFKCKFCPSSFADPSTCIKHERIHTNERPYICDICGKAFSYSNVLKVHMMMHTGEKPYSCEHCGKKFAQLHHKKSHERTHNTPTEVKQEEPEEDDGTFND